MTRNALPLPRRLRRLRTLATLATLALALTASAGLAACGSGGGGDSASGGGKTVRYQSFPGQPTLIELADDLGYLGDLKIKSVGTTISGPQDIQSTATNQIDIGSAFDGAVVKLIQAGAPIKAVLGSYGSNTKSFQGTYVLDHSPIKGPRDLIGKKVAVNTLGAHAEAVLQTWLRQGGLSEKEIKQVELVVLPPVNTEQALRARQIDAAILSGILQDKAKDRGGVRLLFSDQKLFGNFTAGTYVLRKDFIAKNPEVAKTLVSGIAKAIAWTQEQPRQTVVDRIISIVKKRGRPEEADALKYWKSTGIAQEGGVVDPADLQRWITWLEKSGQIPAGSVKVGDAFTNEFNPYAKQAARR